MSKELKNKLSEYQILKEEILHTDYPERVRREMLEDVNYNIARIEFLLDQEYKEKTLRHMRYLLYAFCVLSFGMLLYALKH